MKPSLFKALSTVLLFTFPLTAKADVVTISTVTATVQPVGGGVFEILFEMTLPQLPPKVNIDYAELSFGVNLTEPASARFLEILPADSSGTPARYHSVPVTALLPKNKTGLAQIDLDVTQLVDLWVNGGAKNEGIRLVSHRRVSERGLQTGKVLLAPNFKAPAVRIFYTAQRK